jgi:hypothetical protein
LGAQTIKIANFSEGKFAATRDFPIGQAFGLQGIGLRIAVSATFVRDPSTPDGWETYSRNNPCPADHDLAELLNNRPSRQIAYVSMAKAVELIHAADKQ